MQNEIKDTRAYLGAARQQHRNEHSAQWLLMSAGEW